MERTGNTLPLKYPPHILDEIRARLPASQVVGRRVQLRKAGREWKGLSPFNAERTPSFTVNDQKAFYHCFSSGKHGDIFTFLMETEGLSFPEAVERLAGEAGVPLPEPSREDAAQEAQRRSLYEVVEMAAAFFEAALRSKAGQTARDYLARRGLEGEVLKEFRIGYALSDRFALRDHLADKDVPLAIMAEAGLVAGGETVAPDRFRDRIIFPIADGRGRVIAFGGRTMRADVPAKYLNSPETSLFHKGQLLYNLHRARQPAHERGTLIVVEGYVDVIAMTLAGHPHTVAPLGTALTSDQLALLWRSAEEPVLCFDGDAAGRRAAHRVLDLALPLLESGRSLRFALLPQGQDPDDLARSGGSDAVRRVVDGARPLADMLWEREFEAGPLDTPERRAALEGRLRQAVASIGDDTLRRYYRADIDRRIADLNPAPVGRARNRRGLERGPAAQPGTRIPSGFQASSSLLRHPLFAAAVPGGGVEPRHGPSGQSGQSGFGLFREAMIVAVLLAHPDLLQHHAEALAELDLVHREAHRLRQFLLDWAGGGEATDPLVMDTRLARARLDEAASHLAAIVRPGDRWLLAPNADPVRVEDALRQALTLHRRALALHSELRAAERALAEEDSEANLAWLREVQSQLLSADGAEADMEER